MLEQKPYVGRFAPSPTGPLHFGSLLTAVASFCDAKAAGGKWLLRIEDTDIPRIQVDSESAILTALNAFALYPDASILRQRERIDLYESVLAELATHHEVYACQCSRKDLAGQSVYNNHCRYLNLDFSQQAIRLKTHDDPIVFVDRLQGIQRSHLMQDLGDFVLKRRDGIISYQLAVVVDDALQGVTHVVRGADLMDNTARQIYLGQRLDYAQLSYLHLPLAMNQSGQKLSKQNLAQALNIKQASRLLQQALNALGQAPVDLDTPERMLKQAVLQWSIQHIPHGLQLSGIYH